MKLAAVDSLASVEALMALEEQLVGPLTNRIPALKAFLLKPFEAQCINGGNNFRTWVVARQGSSVLFLSLETASFGVGVLADLAQVVEPQHYPTIDIAANNFLGTIKEAAWRIKRRSKALPSVAGRRKSVAPLSLVVSRLEHAPRGETQ